MRATRDAVWSEGIDVGYLTSAGAVHTSIATSAMTRIRAMGPMCPTTKWGLTKWERFGTVKGQTERALIGN